MPGFLPGIFAFMRAALNGPAQQRRSLNGRPGHDRHDQVKISS
jgi:hypothetical protein